MLIEQKQLKDIANWMKVEHPAELPEVLQGIFFRDGNVVPDDCLTMYSSDWKGDERTLLLRVFDQEFQRWYPPRDLSVESIQNRKSKILKAPHLSVGSPLKSKI
ncbi:MULTISPECIES: hypothetical protein [unclassified Microcoleus]|uniref:hypothetical protein n=1 Tax=unclassified Microcoleus TaxID=2642155 RepID=UPI002FD16C92